MNSKQNLIINLSGGKDSTALLRMAIDRGLRIHSAVFFDTGWEFPQMYKHLNKLEQDVNVPIIRLSPKRDFEEELRINRWPSIKRKWCTRRKINAINKYVNKYDGMSLIGFAVDEQRRVKESNKKALYPLIKWGVTEKDALAYCLSKGYSWGGLYNHFDRVSCFCCPLKKILDYRNIRRHYPELWSRMLAFDRSLVSPNRGFYGRKTVHDLDKRFAEEDRQMCLPFYDEAVGAL